MNSNSIATLTLGDSAENHAGMEKIGTMVNKGEGHNLHDLILIKDNLAQIGIECEIIRLDLNQRYDEIDFNMPVPEDAYILIIKNGVNALLRDVSEYNLNMVFQEQCNLEHDKLAWMKGRVVNKHKRWNLCFDDYNRDPDYENKMGRIVDYNDVPITKLLISQIYRYFGDKSQNLKGEGNYYYDVSKCGIGFHGDTERRKVIGIRFGTDGLESTPLYYQWFYHSNPLGERITIPLNAGDIYVMSEKAVGQDWRKKNIPTLRHATGNI